MPTSRLTQRRVDALKPRRTTCDIRDTEIKGFGVRILPSGRKRYFLHSQVDGNRVWHAIGDAEDITDGVCPHAGESLAGVEAVRW